jgi:hypothetical protein
VQIGRLPLPGCKGQGTAHVTLHAGSMDITDFLNTTKTQFTTAMKTPSMLVTP